MRSIIGEKQNFAEWIATGAGSGYITPAPGTWGSLFGLSVGLLIFNSVGVWPLLVISLIYAGLSWWAVMIMERASGEHDASSIVCDEILAVWLIICLIPTNAPLWMLGSFVAFRALDALKPWPISLVDRDVAGATGVMMDDLAAAFIVILTSWGLYAGLNL